jgi:hypothetical protein
MMDSIFDKIKTAATNVSNKIKTGNQQTESLGKELAARAQMTNAALSKPESPATPTTSSSSPVDRVGRKYTDHPGAKDIDTTEMRKPLGSFKKGTPAVPKTGIYKLHKGEAVTPAEKNPMNPFAKITDGDKKPRKALKEMHVKATDNGKHIVTHKHHHPEHHSDEHHAMGDVAELTQHMAQNAPNIEPQAPAMDESAGPAAGAAPAAPGM